MLLTTGDGDTLLAGRVVDQVALPGLLQQLRDIGLPLASVCQVEVDVEARPPPHPDTTRAQPLSAVVPSIRAMTAPTPYLHLPGTAREALTFYADVFGCGVQLHTFEEFGRDDGPQDAIAHGYLTDGPVGLFAADVAGGEATFRSEGLMWSLLGAAESATLQAWFSRLSEGGRVVDDLQARAWGASDGQVVDRFGLHWLVGFEGDDES